MREILASLSLAQDDDPKSGDLGVLPYALHLGLTYRLEAGALIVTMPFKQDLVGSPMPARLHGGVIGGLLEMTAAIALMREMDQSAEHPLLVPKPVNVTVDYLREGRPEETHAQAHVTKIGRRFGNVRVEAWQSDRERLIAVAHINMLYAP